MAASTSPPTWRASTVLGSPALAGLPLRRLAAAAPIALAAALAGAWLLAGPGSADLAAAEHRAAVASGGLVLWDNGWYGGHPTPGYGPLSPLLGAALGVRPVAALSVVVAAVLFAALARRAWDGRRAELAALWFAGGVAVQLLTGRMAFLLGIAVGLGALLAARRERRWPALVLAALTPAASPVAAAFLVLAAVAWGAGARRRGPLALGAVAAATLLLLARLFPEAGTEPFVAAAFWPAAAALVALFAMLPRGERVLRAGAALAALACAGAFLVPSALGGNVTRLGALCAGPLAAGALWPERRRALAVLALPLAWWQLYPPGRDLAAAIGDPSTSAAWTAPLLAELRADSGPGWALSGRIEVPMTAERREAVALPAAGALLARGWERQLDRSLAAPLYRRRLTAASYLAWLRDEGVRWVALPAVPLDGSARAEAALLRRGVPGLRPIWRSPGWRLWEVSRPAPLAAGAARLTGLGPDAIALRAPRPGGVLLRVRWSPYWAIAAGYGCVSRSPGGWTALALTRPGPVRVVQRFSLLRGLAQAAGPRCRAPSTHQ